MTAVFVRPDPRRPAELVEPLAFLGRSHFEELRALVEGDLPYVLRTEQQPDGSRVLYGRPGRKDEENPFSELPLARISYAEACRFLRERTAVLALESL